MLSQRHCIDGTNPVPFCRSQGVFLVSDEVGGTPKTSADTPQNKAVTETPHTAPNNNHGMSLTQGIVIAVVILIALIAIKPKKPKG
ncbi:hypothetical protein [Shewanella sp.]|jgi:hypothetical protein|uniref:hypothetical protein n=1 Tax=Shewanella sp. TaxID=50422 RepID=UPI003D0A4EB4